MILFYFILFGVQAERLIEAIDVALEERTKIDAWTARQEKAGTEVRRAVVCTQDSTLYL